METPIHVALQPSGLFTVGILDKIRADSVLQLVAMPVLHVPPLQLSHVAAVLAALSRLVQLVPVT